MKPVGFLLGGFVRQGGLRGSRHRRSVRLRLAPPPRLRLFFLSLRRLRLLASFRRSFRRFVVASFRRLRLPRLPRPLRLASARVRLLPLASARRLLGPSSPRLFVRGGGALRRLHRALVRVARQLRLALELRPAPRELSLVRGGGGRSRLRLRLASRRVLPNGARLLVASRRLRLRRARSLRRLAVALFLGARSHLRLPRLGLLLARSLRLLRLVHLREQALLFPERLLPRVLLGGALEPGRDAGDDESVHRRVPVPARLLGDVRQRLEALEVRRLHLHVDRRQALLREREGGRQRGRELRDSVRQVRGFRGNRAFAARDVLAPPPRLSRDVGVLRPFASFRRHRLAERLKRRAAVPYRARDALVLVGRIPDPPHVHLMPRLEFLHHRLEPRRERRRGAIGGALPPFRRGGGFLLRRLRLVPHLLPPSLDRPDGLLPLALAPLQVLELDLALGDVELVQPRAEPRRRATQRVPVSPPRLERRDVRRALGVQPAGTPSLGRRDATVQHEDLVHHRADRRLRPKRLRDEGLVALEKRVGGGDGARLRLLRLGAERTPLSVRVRVAVQPVEQTLAEEVFPGALALADVRV